MDLSMDVSTKILKSKAPFSGLPVDVLTKLAKTAKIKAYTKGATVFSSGATDTKEAFLVYGKVRLESMDGKVTHLKQLDLKARHALSAMKPRKYTAIAETHDTCILWIHSRIIENLLAMEQSHEGIKTEMIPDRRLQQRNAGL